MSCLDKGDLDAAIAALTEAIRLDPRNSQAHFHRGIAHEQAGEHDKAVKDYTEAIQLNPKNAEWFPMDEASKDDDPRLQVGLKLLEQAAGKSGWKLNSNGFTDEENTLLAATYRPSEIATLVGVGLGRIAGELSE